MGFGPPSIPMLVYRETDGDSEQVFQSVYNVGNVSMTPGHGVVWQYTSGAGDGFGVNFAAGDIAEILFAGIVGTGGIPPKRVGSILVRGHTDTVRIAYWDAHTRAYTSIRTAALTSAIDYKDLYLRPIRTLGTAGEDAWKTGWLGLFRFPSAVQPVAADPCVLPVSSVALMTSDSASATHTSTVKGFVRCL